jgi:hypothetical protein
VNKFSMVADPPRRHPDGAMINFGLKKRQRLQLLLELLGPLAVER